MIARPRAERGAGTGLKHYPDQMRLYVHGAGRTGRDAWPSAAGRDDLFAGLDFARPIEENVASLVSAAPGASVVFAHSVGAVPVFLALQEQALSPRAIVLIEPALYDIARGHSAIESHIETMDRAREHAAAGDLFGYWTIVRPLMFGGEAEAPRWEQEREAVAKFAAKQPPWGFPVQASAISELPTLVVTGNWNEEYEAIASVLVTEGALHRKLPGNMHRPQDHPGFASAVEEFLGAI